jgi:hypothetical protein
MQVAYRFHATNFASFVATQLITLGESGSLATSVVWLLLNPRQF